MKFLQKYLLWILLAGSIAFAGYVYINKKGPCQVPIEYTLGSFDTRFNISKKEFIADIEEASHVWENALGKNLFEYSADNHAPTRFEYYFVRTPIPVNLVYDDRQKNADATRALTSQIDSTRQTATEVKAQFTALQTKYAQSKAEYQTLLTAYKARKGDWNTLEQKRIEVNTLADSINELVKKYNSLVGEVNTRVDIINQTAGDEFEEGLYISDEKGERINIYEFGNHDSLVRVLAHELGHALGLDHNRNENSIMYYLNSSKNMTPTKEDIAALKAVCMMR